MRSLSRKCFIFCLSIKTQPVQIVKSSYICQINYFNKNISYKTKTHFQHFRGKSYPVKQVIDTTKVAIPSHGEVYSKYLDDSVCRWLPTCWLFSLGSPVSFIYITDRHEILLKITVNTNDHNIVMVIFMNQSIVRQLSFQLWRHLPCMSTSYKVLLIWNLLLCWFYISLV